MAVYRPKRNGIESKFYVYEFVYQGKRFQNSTGVTTKTAAKEIEKQRKAELERAHAGIPMQKVQRIRTVNEIAKIYLDGFRLNHRPKSIISAEGSLANLGQVLGNVLLSDLTEEKIREYIRHRQHLGLSGRSIKHGIGRTLARDRPHVEGAMAESA